LRLIDDEINLSTMFDSRSTWEDYLLKHGSHDFFINERKKFHRHSTVGSFYILPDAFYFPSVGEAKSSSEEQGPSSALFYSMMVLLFNNTLWNNNS